MPAVAAFVASIFTFTITVSPAVASFLIAIAPAVNAITSSLLISWGLSIAGSLLRQKPRIPKAEDGKVGIRQATAPRISGYGRARIAGVYMLYEERSGSSYDVLAFHDGRIDGVERYFLHDDEVTVTGGIVQATSEGAYGGTFVRLRTTLGLPTETAFAETVSAVGDIWTTSHRGDGVASIELVCGGVGQQDFSRIYPNGLPQPSVVARLQRVYDPRDPGHNAADSATWEWTDNPILALSHFLTDANAGMGLPFARRIQPAISYWARAADVCDQPIALKAGGTEKRYRCGGWFYHDTDPIEVIDMLLTCCDGWMAPRGDGAIIVRAGEFEEPTVTFTTEHILEFSTQRFTADEDAINELVVGYTSPTNYADVEAPAWIDEEDKAARGKDRVSSVQATWVQSGSQARRLAKRQVLRSNAQVRGSIRTTMFGLTALGERFVRIQNPAIPSVADITVEIVRLEFDLTNMTVFIEWVKVGAEIDAWAPELEEGESEGTVLVPGATSPDALFGTTAEPFVEYTDEITGSVGARIRFRFTPPTRQDLGYVIATYQSGTNVVQALSYKEDLFNSANVVANVGQLDTRYVLTNKTYKAKIATVAPGGTRGAFSSEFTVVTTGVGLHPPPPRLITVTSPSAGRVDVAWTNCPFGEVSLTQVFRGGATSDFSSASQVGADITGTYNTTGAVSHTGLAAGTYRYWLRHKNSAGLLTLDPAGPFTVTVS